MSEAEARFTWPDYVVTVIMLLVSLGIGIFFALFKGGQKTKLEYLLGNREMGMVPVCLSLFVTFQSAISLIGTPGETYDTGPMIVYINYGIALAYVVGFFTVVPVMYPLHLTSVFEYLDMRFQSKAVRLLCTCIGMLQTMLYMAVALYSPALALQAAAGLPLWVSVVIVGGIGTVYTAIGGIKSVIWTDAFQTLVVFLGMATVLAKGIGAVGGFTEMIEKAKSGGRTNFAELNPDPRERHSVWSCVIGGCFFWLVNCFNQSSVQRIGALKTLTSAKVAFMLNAPLNVIYGSTLTLTGLLLYAYVVTIGCDPFQAGLISNKNQIMPYYVIHVLTDMPGFAGLYMSMLFSGALSTVSSGINALSANTIEDLLARPLKNVKDGTVTVIAKFLVAFYGVVVVGLAYLMKSLSGPVTQLGVTAFGAFGGPITGVFLLAGGFPWANKFGAFGGVLIGLAVNLWIAIGARLYGQPTVSLPPGPTHGCYTENTSFPMSLNVTSESLYYGDTTVAALTSPWLENTTSASDGGERPFSIYDISYVYFGAVGVIVTFITGAVLSCITGCTDRKTVDPRLIFPFCRKLYRMPEPVYTPDDTSNVYATKHIREAWDKFKKRGLQVDVARDDSDVVRNSGYYQVNRPNGNGSSQQHGHFQEHAEETETGATEMQAFLQNDQTASLDYRRV